MTARTRNELGARVSAYALLDVTRELNRQPQRPGALARDVIDNHDVAGTEGRLTGFSEDVRRSMAVRNSNEVEGGGGKTAAWSARNPATRPSPPPDLRGPQQISNAAVRNNNPFDVVVQRRALDGTNLPAPSSVEAYRQFDRDRSTAQRHIDPPGVAAGFFVTSPPSNVYPAYPVESGPPAQALFPNATGTFPVHHHQETLRRQALTPPIPSVGSGPWWATANANTNPFFAHGLHPDPYPPIDAGSAVPAEAGPAGYGIGPHSAFSDLPLSPPLVSSSSRHGKADTSSILALFDQPHLAPPRPPAPADHPPSDLDSIAVDPLTAPSSSAGTGRARAGPPTGSRNPFSPALSMPSPVHPGPRHTTQERADVVSCTATGRDSPDAFVSLSARSVG
ncbi:MAG: hypothetical protein M1826_001671 [Phylliscum demangeonii]|nr:MAG: hypothetical protein M1826_001671 [Phylliscum demangeonii]